MSPDETSAGRPWVAPLLRFGLFELDTENGQLLKGRSAVKLQDQPLKFLVALTREAGRVVPREELYSVLWPGEVHVDFEAGLKTVVRKARQALGDDAENPRFIETVPRQGYRFIAPVSVDVPRSNRIAVMPTPRIEERAELEIAPQVLVAPPRAWPWRRFLALFAVAVMAAGVSWWGLGENGSRHSEFTLSTITSYPGGQHDPAISADGRQVAFSWSPEAGRNADLYVVMSDGGSPKRVTTGYNADDLPAWSPDGTELAFIRAAKFLMIVSPLGGGERKLGTGYASFVSWCCKGKLILHCDWDSGHNHLAVFASDPATGSRRQVTFRPENATGDTNAELSPDGKTLAFTRCTLGNCDIFTTPIQGGRVSRITHDECSFNGLTWMPDGRNIVYSSRRKGPFMLWRVAASGSGSPEQISAADDASFPKASRGPGGTVRIVFEQHVRNSNIWRRRLAGNASDAVATTGDRLIASTRLDSSPQFSPDGRRIAFATDRTGYQEIWSSDADGNNQAAVTNLRAQSTGSPRWSPDGNRIAFDVLSTKGRAIYLVDMRGGPPQQWTPWGNAARPSWSRDGRWIFFGGRDPAGGTQVWKISTSSDRTIQQVTSDGGFEAYESADGRTLYYTKGTELRGMPADGGAWKRTTDHPVQHGWWSVTAAGIYLVELPDPDSQTPKVSFPVLLIDPGAGFARQVDSIDGPVVRATPDFTVSADGRTLLYSRLEVSTSQIRMIEER